MATPSPDSSESTLTVKHLTGSVHQEVNVTRLVKSGSGSGRVRQVAFQRLDLRSVGPSLQPAGIFVDRDDPCTSTEQVGGDLLPDARGRAGDHRRAAAEVVTRPDGGVQGSVARAHQQPEAPSDADGQ